jgi:DNA-binding transcriptional LysR family regulator
MVGRPQGGVVAVTPAVMAGVGIATVSRLAVTPAERQGLRCTVAIADVRGERQISIVQRTDTRPPATAPVFLHVLSQQHRHCPLRGRADSSILVR